MEEGGEAWCGAVEEAIKRVPQGHAGEVPCPSVSPWSFFWPAPAWGKDRRHRGLFFFLQPLLHLAMVLVGNLVYGGRAKSSKIKTDDRNLFCFIIRYRLGKCPRVAARGQSILTSKQNKKK
jgi:hypothetical protein